MKQAHSISAKIYARAVIAIILIVSWIALWLSGLVLWLAPSGPRSGRLPLLFDYTKTEWRDIHLWIALAFTIITIIHVIIDWKTLRGVIRYLISVNRRPELLSEK